MYDRDLDDAGSLAAVLPQKNTLMPASVKVSRDFWLGVVARLKGDAVAARAAFMKARTQQEEELRVHPDNMDLLSDLGLIDAGLGRKEEALSEGRRAMELEPIAQEAMFGSCPTEVYVKMSFAIICAWVGETELALEQLEAVTKIPGWSNLWRLALEPDLGSLPWRSALRKNRRLLSAQREVLNAAFWSESVMTRCSTRWKSGLAGLLLRVTQNEFLRLRRLPSS